MDSSNFRKYVGSFRKSGAKIPRSLKVLVIFLMVSAGVYLLLYHFYVGSATTLSGITSENTHRRYLLSSEHFEETETPTSREHYLTSDKLDLNLENIGDIIGKLSKDINDIKMKLKLLDRNSSVSEVRNSSVSGDVGENPEPRRMSETLLTLFSTWTSTSAIHKNTLKNWGSFKPVVNPVLFTNDTVLAKMAEASGWTILHISKTAENGLPVLKYMYIDAIKAFDSTFYCYANSDILFDGGLIKTLVNLDYTLGNSLSARPLFATGLRWNVINVSEKEISPRKNISVVIKRRGKVFSTSAEDYFITNKIYPWRDIPEVVVAAIAYDNWLVANAREKKHFTINTSRTIPALHQSVDEFDHRSHMRDTVNYNVNLLKEIYKINLPYHKGFLECIEKYTDFVNDTFVLGDRMVGQYCN